MLAAITRADRKEWTAEIGPIVRQFFDPSEGKLHHKRIDSELAKAMQNQSKRTAAANARWDKERCKPDAHEYANASDMQSTCNDPRARSPSPSSKKEDSELRSAPPIAVRRTDATDPGAPTLFGDGLAAMARMVGKRPDTMRAALGALRKEARDDGFLLDLIREAEHRSIVDPIPWLKAAIKARKAAPLFDAAPEAPDPWGVRAWTARQTDVAPGNVGGATVPCIGGYGVETVAEIVADAADLPGTWRGSWDALGAWMRDDIWMSSSVVAAIRSQAGRMRSQGQTIGSIAVFDNAVRSARSAS
jgi:hypothetical protein